MLCVLDREVLMCYVLALLMMHVEGGPLHPPLLRPLSFLMSRLLQVLSTESICVRVVFSR